MNQRWVYLMMPLLGGCLSAIFVTPSAYFNGIAAGRNEALLTLSPQLEQINQEKAELQARANNLNALVKQAKTRIEATTRYAGELADVNGKLNLEVNELNEALGQCKTALKTTEVQAIKTTDTLSGVSATSDTVSPVN